MKKTMKKLSNHGHGVKHDSDMNDRDVRYSDTYGRQRHDSDGREGMHDTHGGREGRYQKKSKDDEKDDKWRKMTRLSANYARSAR